MFKMPQKLFQLSGGDPEIADISLAGGGSNTRLVVSAAGTPVTETNLAPDGGTLTITVSHLAQGYDLQITPKLVPIAPITPAPVIPADTVRLTSAQGHAAPDGDGLLSAGEVVHYVLSAENGVNVSCSSGANNTSISATLTGPRGATAAGEGVYFPLSLDDGAGDYLLSITLSADDTLYTTMTAH